MELTPEDRQRIYEEEKARIEAGERPASSFSRSLRSEFTKKLAPKDLFWITPAAFVLVLFVLVASQPEKAGEGTPPNAAEVTVACKEFVRQRLIAPSTAEFASAYEQIHTVKLLSAGHFELASYVDSQNVFGAQVRANFVCSVTSADKGTWQLERLSFDDSLVERGRRLSQ